MLPNPENDIPGDDEDADSIEMSKSKYTDMQGLRSPTTGVPYTPRTMAFRTLDSRN
jgi:hypothetical protein